MFSWDGSVVLHSAGQILDFDAVFRDDIDPSTFDLYVGCGGCMPSDPIVVHPYNFSEYQEVEIEPFTQTAYRSAFPMENRTFDTSLLANCSQGHFTIRYFFLGVSWTWRRTKHKYLIDGYHDAPFCSALRSHSHCHAHGGIYSLRPHGQVCGQV
jgi:hypothetical protein